jgi:hypothetical protein
MGGRRIVGLGTRCVWRIYGESDETDGAQIFLISALNHHVSVVKLRVHDEYLNYLETGEFRGQKQLEELPEDWSSPSVTRTRWYDLLKAEERAEAFVKIWGVAGFLSRL